MKSQSDLVHALAQLDPQVGSVLGEHIHDCGELLPHVFLGDIARLVIDLAQRGDSRSKFLVRVIVGVLENALTEGSDQVRELVCASFVENLLGEDGIDKLRPLLPTALSEALARLDAG